MNRLAKVTVLAMLVASVLPAQNRKPAAPGLPPLLDRELFFGNPEIVNAEISPDGQYIAFLKPWHDTRNIWVKKTDEPFSAAKLLTAETKRPIPFYTWTRDGKYVLYIKDQDGDENFNLLAVDPAAVPSPGSDAPPSRNLTARKGVRVMLYSQPKHDPDSAYIGLNDRDKAWHDLYKLKISTGELTLLRKNTERISAWVFDLEGHLRLATRTADNGDTEILRVDPDRFTKVYSCDVFETCEPLRFEKGGKRVYMETNKGQDVSLISLVLFDPENGKTEMVESDPLKRVDLGGVSFSEATDELWETMYVDARERRYFRDKNLAADRKWLESKLPGKEVDATSRTLDERLWLVTAHSDTEPGETYLFDRRTRQLTFQYKLWEKLPREALAEMKPVTYPSSDGLEIPAYLTLPKGVAAKGLPAIILPHGGPWGRDVWGFHGLTQFLANRGYAVLMQNFRGSTGYGKKFLDAGNGEWGRKMQDDLTWGVKYLVAQGVADPKRVGILGGSYGGYATLAGVTFTPDLYAAAVDIVGPSDLPSLLESIPPYWEAQRKILYSRVADPSTSAGRALLESESPLRYVDKIKTPLMVVQGANDPRVNRSQAEEIVIALRDRGYPVAYLMAPDEGHGFQRPVNNMACFMAAEAFLAKYLGGRYQASGTPEVTERLAEISVDPKTVVLAKKIDVSTVGAPKPSLDLKAGTYKYQAKIAAGGQELSLNVTTTITAANGAWMATEAAQSPMGDTMDTATLEKGTLLLQKRELSQGPIKIHLDFAGNKAAGSMSINGQEHPVDADLGGPLFADAAGAPESIGCLPLADGYSTTFRNFDLQKQKVKIMQLKVAGGETVTVPAGTFDTFKVEITPADGGPDKETLWIAKDSRAVVKISAVMSQMGGATLTEELLP
jgi:dipeptidyl aminopeptidase/acylaminoacyl peptidase